MHPKYYLFDVGLINSICGRISPSSVQGTATYGMLFEHFVILETYRLIQYAEKPYRIYHWRSSHGAEVDMIIETADDLWAIEIKSNPIVKSSNLTGLMSFVADHPKANLMCVSTCDRPYLTGSIPVIPWNTLFGKDYLDLLP